MFLRRAEIRVLPLRGNSGVRELAPALADAS